jgi:predicted ester cyclase
MTLQENKALVRRWFDSATYKDMLNKARAARNPKAEEEKLFRSLAAELFAPDCVIHYPDGDGTPERLVQYHLATLDAFPDVSFTIDDMIAESDKVVVRGRMAGTNLGPFHGLPATGKKVEMGYVTICRVAGGKVAESWGYNDSLRLMQQLGALAGSKKE